MQVLDTTGKPVKSSDFKKCPNCGRDPKDFVPSSGFGAPWTVCPCGKEFKEIPWQVVIP